MDEQIISQIKELVEASGPQNFSEIFTECFVQCPDVEQTPAGAGVVHNHILYMVATGSLYQGVIDKEIIYSDDPNDF